MLTIAVAETAPLSFGAELAPASRYFWRGMAASEGPVAQPSVWLTLGDFTFSPWANFVLGREDNQWKFNEVDLTISYEREWFGVEFSPWVAYYLYPNQADVPATAELCLELSRPVGPLEVSTSHTVDLLAYPGAYYGTLGLEYEHELASELCAGLSVEAGLGSAKFNQSYLGVSRTTLSAVEAEVSLTWSPGSLLYLRPFVRLGRLVDSELSEAAETQNTFSVGLAIGKEF